MNVFCFLFQKYKKIRALRALSSLITFPRYTKYNHLLNCELWRVLCDLAYVFQSHAQRSWYAFFDSVYATDIRGITIWILPKSYFTSLPEQACLWQSLVSSRFVKYSTPYLPVCLLALAKHKKCHRNHSLVLFPFWRLFISVLREEGKFRAHLHAYNRHCYKLSVIGLDRLIPCGFRKPVITAWCHNWLKTWSFYGSPCEASVSPHPPPDQHPGYGPEYK